MIHRSVQKDGIILEINVFYAFLELKTFIFLFCFEEGDRICIYIKKRVYRKLRYIWIILIFIHLILNQFNNCTK